jgi:hypothetical protein
MTTPREPEDVRSCGAVEALERRFSNWGGATWRQHPEAWRGRRRSRQTRNLAGTSAPAQRVLLRVAPPLFFRFRPPECAATIRRGGKL